jgi:hypothetical protein
MASSDRHTQPGCPDQPVSTSSIPPKKVMRTGQDKHSPNPIQLLPTRPRDHLPHNLQRRIPKRQTLDDRDRPLRRRPAVRMNVDAAIHHFKPIPLALTQTARVPQKLLPRGDDEHVVPFRFELWAEVLSQGGVVPAASDERGVEGIEYAFDFLRFLGLDCGADAVPWAGDPVDGCRAFGRSAGSDVAHVCGWIWK